MTRLLKKVSKIKNDKIEERIKKLEVFNNKFTEYEVTDKNKRMNEEEFNNMKKEFLQIVKKTGEKRTKEEKNKELKKLINNEFGDKKQKKKKNIKSIFQ